MRKIAESSANVVRFVESHAQIVKIAESSVKYTRFYDLGAIRRI